MILAFGGILFNMTIQSMAECLGIAKLSHSSFYQSTLILFSLISFDVSAHKNLGDEDHKALSSYIVTLIQPETVYFAGFQIYTLYLSTDASLAST